MIVGCTIFMISVGRVKWMPKARRSSTSGAGVGNGMLEEGAEDFRLHLGPVVLGRLAEQDEFGVRQFHAGRFERRGRR